ncbi:Hypothetical predicted protein [Podarcis lilfordi]|uniref:Uncharacterized protein n=1 Tax=Podarcis lilfordi TaxID=74358 RepID=A0AA35PGS8_9SAUR|nr:Hypothetical predicted protein [Podarcis lilfordi]
MGLYTLADEHCHEVWKQCSGCVHVSSQVEFRSLLYSMILGHSTVTALVLFYAVLLENARLLLLCVN